MARCLRCNAGNEWIQGRVKDEPSRSHGESSKQNVILKEQLLTAQGQIDRLCDEIQLAIAVLNPNMPGSGLEDAARQVKQVAISQTENCEKLAALVETYKLQAVANLEMSQLKGEEIRELRTELESAQKSFEQYCFDLEQAQKQRDQYREALKKLEWSGRSGLYQCPACGNLRISINEAIDGVANHQPDCWLDGVLKGRS